MLGKTFDFDGGAGGSNGVERRKKYSGKRSQSLFPGAAGSISAGTLASLSALAERQGSNDDEDEPEISRKLSGGRSGHSASMKVKRSATTARDEMHGMGRRFSKLPGLVKAVDEPKAAGTSADGSATALPAAAPASTKAKKIDVHAYTEDPSTAWEMVKAKRAVKLVRPMGLETPVKEEAVRFVAMSDIHSRALDPAAIPPGDVLLVAGDFTTVGHPHEVKAFVKFLAKLPHRYKVVVAGNHECSFDAAFMKVSGLDRLMGGDSKEEQLKASLREAMGEAGLSDVRSLLTAAPGLVYLEDSGTKLFGLSLWGSPWVPAADSWAFNLPRGQELLTKWNAIPVGVDVLVTHTPPLGHGDLTGSGVRTGCVELLSTVSSRVRPKYHVFGHIHDGAGCTTDGYTKFINACICDNKMKPVNPPIIFDVPLPPGQHKTKVHPGPSNRRPRKSL